MTPYYADDQVTLYHGDALDVLRTMPDGSVDCVVTSPPYYGLRDYGVPGQYGLESSPAEYVETMRRVFAEVRRVLASDGTLWLNLGDSYANDAKWGGSSGGKHVEALHGQTGIGRGRRSTALPPKSLMGRRGPAHHTGRRPAVSYRPQITNRAGFARYAAPEEIAHHLAADALAAAITHRSET